MWVLVTYLSLKILKAGADYFSKILICFWKIVTQLVYISKINFPKKICIRKIFVESTTINNLFQEISTIISNKKKKKKISILTSIESFTLKQHHKTGSTVNARHMFSYATRTPIFRCHLTEKYRRHPWMLKCYHPFTLFFPLYPYPLFLVPRSE